jgi:hypothetical protein
MGGNPFRLLAALVLVIVLKVDLLCFAAGPAERKSPSECKLYGLQCQLNLLPFAGESADLDAILIAVVEQNRAALDGQPGAAVPT